MESASSRLPITVPPTAPAGNFWSLPGRLSPESAQEERTDTVILARKPWLGLKRQAFRRFFAAFGPGLYAWRPTEEQFRQDTPAHGREAAAISYVILNSFL